MLSGSTRPRIMACNVALAQSGTISVYTLPPRLKIPKTGVFLYAPRPRLPLILLPPKYDSSTSIFPLTGDCCSQNSVIRFLIRVKYRLTVFLFKPVKEAMVLASKSCTKYLISSLNFASEIFARFAYLFFYSHDKNLG